MAKPDKRLGKQGVFLGRVQSILPEKYWPNLYGPRQQSIRVNALKSDLTFSRPIKWAANCYWFSGDKSKLTHGKDFDQGHIYLQNAASFIPPLLIDPKPKQRVLDMCAAPGGKASHIAALSNNQAELWVNDNSQTRLNRMMANFERLGVKTHNTTLHVADHLKHDFPHDYFDKILLDAPCSGEGMIDLSDPTSLTQWSTAQIKRMQGLQKRAISTAWELLKPGGHLVYSTCTIAPEENEAVVNYQLRKHHAALLPINLPLENRIPALQQWNNK